MDLRDQLQHTLGDAYSLEHELGGGGMSRVFVAEELSLGRKIVVKVVPPETAAGVSVQRFKREIQVAARLQHPHIVPLLSAGETEGLPYFTMPFVKGESLRVRLARSGELSVNEALHILRDIASALAYAHGEGVVHRDIKPDNVILSGGVAVVTDFGVAKAMDLAATEVEGPKTGITSLGIALGTPAYMSPEQASADVHVDHRSDIYSFGCLAYELLCGSSPFGGRSPQQMLAAHVTETPDRLEKRRPTIPLPFAELVMHCLEKRPGDRPQSATDLLSALDAIGTPSGGTSPTQARLSAVGSGRSLWMVGAAAAIVIGALAMVLWRRGASAPTYSIGSTTAVASTPALEWHPAISPDGRFVAYASQTPNGLRIFVRQIDGGRPVLVAGDFEGDQDLPAWSPDGTRLLFIAKYSVYIVPALGGVARLAFTMTPSSVFGGLTASWSPDGTVIAYSDYDGVRVRAVDGGDSRLVLKGGFLHAPAWSPDGRYLAYVAGAPLAIGNISTSAIWIVAISGEGATRVSDLVHTHASPVWAPDGRSLLFVSSLGGGLDIYQQRIREGGAPIDAPVRLTTGLSPFTISMARDGSRLAYDVIRTQSNVWSLTPASGRTISMSAGRPVTTDNQLVEGLALSHDGQWLVYDSNLRGNYDVYKVRVDGGESVQLTDNRGNDFAPMFSPDDREIVFHSTRDGTRDVYVMSADGGNQRAITSDPMEDFHPRWSPDGNRMLFTSFDTSYHLRGITRGADGSWSAPNIVLDIGQRAQLDWPQVNWSPDGKQIAASTAGNAWVSAADGSGRRVVLERQAAGGDSAHVAMWGTDPSLLYVSSLMRSGGSSIWAVPLSGGAPRKLIVSDPNDGMYTYVFGTDGRRFYIPKAKIEGDVWVMELKR